jgi:hypothetical protein
VAYVGVLVTIPKEHAQKVARGLMDDLEVIADHADLEHVRAGIAYLREKAADDYAFVVALKLQDLQSKHHSVYLGLDKNGKARYAEYYGFNF